MGVNFGKVLGGAAGLASFVPGGQAFAGVLGAAASAFAEPEGVVYLSPYLDANIPAPFGFPSAPAALTARPESQPSPPTVGAGILAALAGGAVAAGPAPANVQALHYMKAGERAPYAPPPGKPNMAGLLRAHAPALRAHPQYLKGGQLKWTDQEGWLNRVARLRVGIQLDTEGRDSAWAFYDDPPTASALANQIGAGGKVQTYRSVTDFAPPPALPTLGFKPPAALQNMAGIPWEKLPKHVDRNLERARAMVKEERARLWEEIQAQQEFEAVLREVEEQYREHVKLALANGVQLVSPETFLNPNAYTPAVAPSLEMAAPGFSQRPAKGPGGGDVLTLAALVAALVVL